MPRAKNVLRTLPLAVAALAAMPAAAQEEPATPAPAAEPSPVSEVLAGVACSLGRDARAGDAVLAAVPFSEGERTATGDFIRGAQRCLRRREPILTPAYVVRGAIAETLYELQFATPPAARTPALAAAPLTRPGLDLPAETVQQLQPMYALADCSAGRQPDLARAVLATEPRSAAEGPAFAAMHPAFGSCVPAGTQLSYDPRFMRVFLAEALYRWAVVQRDGPASPWAAAPAPAAPSGQ